MVAVLTLDAGTDPAIGCDVDGGGSGKDWLAPDILELVPAELRGMGEYGDIQEAESLRAEYSKEDGAVVSLEIPGCGAEDSL